MASSAKNSSVGFEEPPTLGYHKIRGLAAPLRMMFFYKEQAFKNVAYGEDMKDAWFNGDKTALRPKNACINLPYLVAKDSKNPDQEIVVTQSNTLLLYLGHRLDIDTMCDTAVFFHNHTVVDQVMDLRNDLMKIVYPFAGKVKTADEFPDGAKAHVEEIKKTHLTKLENFCKGPYMSGTECPQSGDFHLWEMLDQHCQICESLGVSALLEEFPKLRNLYMAFKALPTLQPYFSSDLYRDYSHNNGVYTHFTGLDPATFKYGQTVSGMIAGA